MDFNSTVKGSMLEGFYPAGWYFEKIDACIDAPDKVCERQDFWNKDFVPVCCNSLGEFETYMGHEIAMQIRLAKERGEKIAFILPVGPMGMYKWVVYFLNEWKVACDHVYTFNMDEWADSEGNTLAADNPGAFQYAMEQALFNPLGELTVPKEHNIGALPCEHHRTRTVLTGGLCNRRCRRHPGTRYAVAGDVLMDDIKAWGYALDYLFLYADPGRKALLLKRTGRAAGGRM